MDSHDLHHLPSPCVTILSVATNRTPLAVKTLEDGTTVRVYTDNRPDHPRRGTSPPFIAAWHPRYPLADPECPTSHTEFLRSVYEEAFPSAPQMRGNNRDRAAFIKNTEYPGVLKKLYVREGGGVQLRTADCSPFGQWEHVGYVYVPVDTIRSGAMSRETAEMFIDRDLRDLEDYLNWRAYALFVEFSDGETDSIGALYADGNREEAWDELASEWFDLPLASLQTTNWNHS